MFWLKKDTDKSRDLNLIIWKVLSFKKDFTIVIGVQNNFEIYNENLKRNTQLEEQINKILKDIHVCEADLLILLNKFNISSEQEILSKRTLKFIDFPEDNIYFLTKYPWTNYNIYFSVSSKKIIIDIGNTLKEEKIIEKETKEEDKEDLNNTRIVLSDELDLNYLEWLNLIETNDNWRDIVKWMDSLIKFCLKNDIWDIVIAEDDFPYFVKWESIINDEKLTELINNKICKEKQFNKKELRWFIKELDKFSKSENILQALEDSFDKKWKWYEDFAININGVKLRVNAAYRAWKKISVVMRVIKSWTPPKMEDLWLVDKYSTAYRDILTQPFWLILVVWPTWSGKSYSLTSMLWEINRTQRKRVITLEDPVEFEHDNILSKFEQREVWVDVITYNAWLKSALRQKPHIIVCWEIRDAEVMELAMEAAATWHVVFWTFHANDVVQTIQRILDFFPVEKKNTILQQLSEILLWVFVQKLVSRKWGWKVLIKEIMVNKWNIGRSIWENDMKSLHIAMENWWNFWMLTNDKSIEILFNDELISDETAYIYAKDKPYIQKITNYDIYKKKIS